MMLNYTKKIILNLKVIYNIVIGNLQKKEYKDTIEGIVFSKDRPIQLFALLESYYKYCDDAVPLYIIYKASDNEYENGYEEVKSYFKKNEVYFIKESSFRNDLINIFHKIQSSHLFFLVDDNVFKSNFSFNDFLTFANKEDYIFSLRLGKNLDYCFTKNITQGLPKLKKEGKFLTWDWSSGESDWNYVFSVDGHIYKTKDVLEMTKLISFKAPNSYETNMNIFRYLLRRKKGLCYPNSVLINVCLNRVQNEVENISGDISVSELLKIWHENRKIDIDYFHDIENQSAHIGLKHLPLIKRN